MEASLELELSRLNASVNHKTVGAQQKITGVSKLNNFNFSSGEMKAWQAFDIGPGKNITLEGTNRNHCILLVSDVILN